MLATMLVVVRPAVVQPDRIDRRVGHSVELVVTEHDLRRPGFDHAPHESDCGELVRATIDEIADEHGGAFRIVPPGAAPLAVPESLQQSPELPDVPVDVPNHVEPAHQVIMHDGEGDETWVVAGQIRVEQRSTLVDEATSQPTQ